jgi:WhiB family redox-sensing transcriptional regulator
MELRQTETATSVDLHPSGYEGVVPHLLKPVEAMANGLEGLLNDPESGIKRVWQDFANCVGITGEGPNLFFVKHAQEIEDAKGVCRTCLARDACLDFALENLIKVGVWGGTTGRQRARLLRQRELTVTQPT